MDGFSSINFNSVQKNNFPVQQQYAPQFAQFQQPLQQNFGQFQQPQTQAQQPYLGQPQQFQQKLQPKQTQNPKDVFDDLFANNIPVAAQPQAQAQAIPVLVKASKKESKIRYITFLIYLFNNTNK